MKHKPFIFRLFHSNNFLRQILRGIDLYTKIMVVSFKKVMMTLKSLKCLHAQKNYYWHIMALSIPNIPNYNIFISLKIAEIFQVYRVTGPPCIFRKNSYQILVSFFVDFFEGQEIIHGSKRNTLWLHWSFHCRLSY